MTILDLIHEIMYYINRYDCTTSNYPSRIANEIDKAVEYKRQGLYQESLEIYLRIIASEKITHTGVLNGLYKVIACAGYLKQAKIILKIGNRVIKNSNSIYNPFGLSNNFEDHFYRLEEAIRSETGLYLYLKSISGNANYKMPKRYIELFIDYMD